MKKSGLITLMLTVLTLGCQRIKNQENVATTDSSTNNRIETQGKINKEELNDNSDKPKELDKFELMFGFEDKEQRLKQGLGVTWLTSDSIEFRLFTEDDICDTNYWGNAKNKYADMDPESDEDENGESYLASEYVSEGQTYLLKIRISLDKDRARIIFTDKSGEETDCIPTPNLVLVKKNVH